jgi:DNA polymerase III epsilon subunit-like protein
MTHVEHEHDHEPADEKLGASHARAILWSDLRLVVIDVETVMAGPELPEDAMDEVMAAIEQVRATGVAVTLRPAKPRTRLLQHRLVDAAGLSSPSKGADPERAVTVAPAVAGSTSPTGPLNPVSGAQHRMASIALVDCRDGKPEEPGWFTLVNPGAPVDAKTGGIHGLTDTKLRTAPTFATVAPTILSKLQAAEGETVVLVAHNAGFDVGAVLRAELERMGRPLPEILVLDTAGRLAQLAGFAPLGNGLEHLLAELEIVNEAPHQALGDAMATARAACALLNAAAAKGSVDIDALLKKAGAKLSGKIKASWPRSWSTPAYSAPEIPEVHEVAHFVLGPKPAADELGGWIAVADDCARFSCPELAFIDANLVVTAQAEPVVVLDALMAALRRRADAKDGPGVNAVIGAIQVLFEHWCPMPMGKDFSGRYPFGRKVTIKAYHEINRLSEPLRRCSLERSCPWSAANRPCPRDEIVRAIAPAVMDPIWKKGRLTRTTTTNAWLHAHDKGGWQYHRQDPFIYRSGSVTSKGGLPAGPVLADAAMAVMVKSYPVWGEEPDRVARSRDALATLIRRDAQDPALHELWAQLMATPGRVPDLVDAIAVADRALAWRPEVTTDSAWASLELFRDHLRGRLARRRDPVRFDEKGNLVAVRRHSAGDKAKRPAVFRFLRS